MLRDRRRVEANIPKNCFCCGWRTQLFYERDPEGRGFVCPHPQLYQLTRFAAAYVDWQAMAWQTAQCVSGESRGFGARALPRPGHLRVRPVGKSGLAVVRPGERQLLPGRAKRQMVSPGVAAVLQAWQAGGHYRIRVLYLRGSRGERCCWMGDCGYVQRAPENQGRIPA